MAKAEADYRSATALNRRRKEPVPDVVCYHCHQGAEKYLKAYLLEQGMTPPRIHDLEDLLNLCALHEAALATHLPLVQALNPFGFKSAIRECRPRSPKRRMPSKLFVVCAP